MGVVHKLRHIAKFQNIQLMKRLLKTRDENFHFGLKKTVKKF